MPHRPKPPKGTFVVLPEEQGGPSFMDLFLKYPARSVTRTVYQWWAALTKVVATFFLELRTERIDLAITGPLPGGKLSKRVITLNDALEQKLAATGNTGDKDAILPRLGAAREGFDIDRRLAAPGDSVDLDQAQADLATMTPQEMRDQDWKVKPSYPSTKKYRAYDLILGHGLPMFYELERAKWEKAKDGLTEGMGLAETGLLDRKAAGEISGKFSALVGLLINGYQDVAKESADGATKYVDYDFFVNQVVEVPFRNKARQKVKVPVYLHRMYRSSWDFEPPAGQIFVTSDWAKRKQPGPVWGEIFSNPYMRWLLYAAMRAADLHDCEPLGRDLAVKGLKGASHAIELWKQGLDPYQTLQDEGFFFTAEEEHEYLRRLRYGFQWGTDDKGKPLWDPPAYLRYLERVHLVGEKAKDNQRFDDAREMLWMMVESVFSGVGFGQVWDDFERMLLDVADHFTLVKERRKLEHGEFGRQTVERVLSDGYGSHRPEEVVKPLTIQAIEAKAPQERTAEESETIALFYQWNPTRLQLKEALLREGDLKELRRLVTRIAAFQDGPREVEELSRKGSGRGWYKKDGKYFPQEWWDSLAKFKQLTGDRDYGVWMAKMECLGYTPNDAPLLNKAEEAWLKGEISAKQAKEDLDDTPVREYIDEFRRVLPKELERIFGPEIAAEL